MLTVTLRIPQESWEMVAPLMVVQTHIWEKELHADMSNALGALLGLNAKVARRILVMNDTTAPIGSPEWYEQFRREIADTVSVIYKMFTEVIIER
jgi:hypothetical protein